MNAVRPGAILVVPVKVDGGGIYVGDWHANQGDRELAQHTTVVSGWTEFEVEGKENLNIDGPLLLPSEEDLSPVVIPFNEEDKNRGRTLGEKYGVAVQTDPAPIQIIGSGATINAATENAYDRTETQLGMDEGEIRTRGTSRGR